MTRQEFEEKALEMARTWVGVPFLHNGRTRSQGVDCLGLIVCLLRDCGIPVPDGDGKAYAPDWYVHTPEERYLSGLLDNGIPVAKEALLPGDVPYFRPGLILRSQNETITHGGVWLGDGRFIHSITGRRVEIAELRQRAWVKAYAGAIRVHPLLHLLGEVPGVVPGTSP